MNEQTQKIIPVQPDNDENKYSAILEKLGLNKNEAQIYELLLNTGPQNMKPILFHTKLKRGNAYYHLDNLAVKGLVEKQDLPGQTTKFIAKHPQNLELLISKQKAAAFAAEEEFNKTLPAMSSLFQLVAIKPEVKFYEGLDGAIKVAEDSLTSQTEILSYIDNEAVNKLFPDVNKAYVGKRKSLGLKKKMITIDSPYIRQHAKDLDKNNTEVRVISSPAPFTTVMQIYGHKVSYISLEGKNLLSVIIENKNIADMHRNLFNVMWQSAKPVLQTGAFRPQLA